MRIPNPLQFARAFAVLGVFAALTMGCTEVEPSGDSGDSIVGIPDIPDSAVVPDSVGDEGTPALDGDGGGETSAPDGSDAIEPGDGGKTDVPDGVVNPECPGAFECPCDENDDCYSGWCIEGPSGPICTDLCDDSCPAGYNCKLIGGAGEPVSVCVPLHPRLCRPCTTNADCDSPYTETPELCIPAGDPSQGSFCGSSCEGGVPCPSGMACEDVATEGGGTTGQCRPVDGQCDCRASWSGAGYETPCENANAAGLCEGLRVCGESGLTDCSAETPAAETCNGIDDDCDGDTDELGDACSLPAGCPGTLACVGGAPVCVGADASAELCNGLDDDCDGETDEKSCDDGIDCTVDVCDGVDSCSNTLADDYCLMPGDICVAAGGPHPDKDCFACVPGTATDDWTGISVKLCEDGDLCTVGDVCALGTCVGTPYICDDGKPCTVDTCDGGGGCSAPIEGDSCLIDDLCHAEGDTTENGCGVCTAATSATEWTDSSAGTTCDDGNPCTANDKCSGGVCAGSPYSCDDGKACTSESCDGAGGCETSVSSGCLIGGNCIAEGATNPSAQCERCLNSQSDGAWSAASGPSCDDGNLCTKVDTCQSGTCVGTAYSCNDSLACTADQCNGVGGCANPILAGNCVIGGQCWGNAATNPGNLCQRCVSGSPNGWSSNNGATCDDGNACTGDDECVGTTCAGTLETDSFEPNNSISGAKYLGSVKDTNDYPKGSISANLHASGDVDWFEFYDKDVTGGTHRPAVDLTGIPASSDYRLCVYFDCEKSGATSIDCKEGSSATGPGGIGGCCSDNPGSAAEKVRLSVSCKCGTFCFDDSGDAFVSVERVGGAASCDDYTLQWGDD